MDISRTVRFLIESDKLKAVERATRPVGLPRKENSAEHSWSLALAAISLIPRIEPSLDTLRVVEMLLIHDLVEIDAGDQICYANQPGKFEAEQKAARRIFGMLPDDEGSRFLALWNEFEKAETRESIFANAMDRLFPLIQNFENGGGSWKEFGIAREQVLRRVELVSRASGTLGEFCHKIIDAAVERGWLGRGS